MNYPTYMVNNIFFTYDRVKRLVDDCLYQLLEGGYTKVQILDMYGEREFIRIIFNDFFKPEFEKYIEENTNFKEIDNLINILLEHAIKSVDVYKITKKALKSIDEDYIEKQLERFNIT